MSKRKTNDEFLKELSIINSNIDILDEYTTNNTRIKCKCKIDGNEWFAFPTNLLKGQGCPKCGRKKYLKYSLNRMRILLIK